MQDYFFEEYEDASNQPNNKPVGPIKKWGGAIISLSVMVVVLIWAYGWAVRKPSEVPMIRAMEGPIRQQPAEPGGDVADHQGLAINQVQAGAEQPSNTARLVMSPNSSGLIGADLPQSQLQPVNMNGENQVQAIGDDADVNIADALMTDKAEAAAGVPTPAAGVGSKLAPVFTLQPPARSRRIARTSAQAVEKPQTPKAPVEKPAVNEIATKTPEKPIVKAVASGTRAVQIGAFDSEAIARKEWARLSGKYASLLGSKGPLIQKTTKNGRVFYRLRATGFSDLSSARNTCAALKSKGQGCIPVTVR